MWRALWLRLFYCFFFNNTATTEIYTLSLHDALPILHLLDGVGPLVDVELLLLLPVHPRVVVVAPERIGPAHDLVAGQDRKSTRLNSSHANISYAVFCLKKKKNMIEQHSLCTNI